MYDYDWKQERIDGVMKEISDMNFTDVATYPDRTLL